MEPVLFKDELVRGVSCRDAKLHTFVIVAANFKSICNSNSIRMEDPLAHTSDFVNYFFIKKLLRNPVFRNLAFE